MKLFQSLESAIVFFEAHKTEIEMQLKQGGEESYQAYWNGANSTTDLVLEVLRAVQFNSSPIVHRQLFVAIADDKINHVSPTWQPQVIASLPENLAYKRYRLLAVISESGIWINHCLTEVLPPSTEEITRLIKESDHPMIQATLNLLSELEKKDQQAIPILPAHYLDL